MATDPSVDDVEDEEEDTREPRTYEISVEVPLTLRFKVEARDEEEALDIATDELRGLSLETYYQAMTSEMVGIKNRQTGSPESDIKFDYPELSCCDEITVEEA